MLIVFKPGMSQKFSFLEPWVSVSKINLTLNKY